MNSTTALRANTGSRVGLQRLILITLLSWLAMVGVDFFLHGGVMAAYWLRESPFLLPPAQAFALIPLGYAAFVLLGVLLVWLMTNLKIGGAREGFFFGLKLGALTWGALCLGLISATTAEWSLIVGWFIGQSIEMAVGGAVVGSAFAGEHLSRLFVRVLSLSLGLAIITIVLQSLGLAPAVRI